MASPESSTVTSRAIASVMIVRRFVARAGGSRTEGDEKFECTAHPRKHCPQ